MRNNYMNSDLQHPFFSRYMRSLLLAALAFGLADGVQILILGFIRNHSLGLVPSALITLILLETIQALVFILVAIGVAYIPSRRLERILRDSPPSRRGAISSMSGVLLGILFLPLCAVVPYFYFHAADEPSYLMRCAEYALPMIIAGLIGSFFLYRFAFGHTLSVSTKARDQSLHP
jgi:hypothetical protein